MALTDISIRALAHGDKPIKKADEKGLFLLLQPSGGKLWRFKYRFAGKEKKLGLGRYPDVSLKEARKRRDDARQKLAMGLDPGVEKKREAEAAAVSASNTFRAVGEEYLAKMERDRREAVTINKSRWLLSLFSDAVASHPIADVTPALLLNALQVVEAKGHHETARRMRSLASRIFRYAAASSRATSDPTSLLKGMGYSAAEMTAHGFRAMASTLLNESGLWSADAIEKALAHDNGSSVRGTYHRGKHWQERVNMAQWWSDFLDSLRSHASSR